MNRDHNHYRNDSNYFKANNSWRGQKYRDHDDNSFRNEFPNSSWKKRYRNDTYKNPKFPNRRPNSTFHDNFYGSNDYYNRGYRPPYSQLQQHFDDDSFDFPPRPATQHQSKSYHKQQFRVENDQHRGRDNTRSAIKDVESKRQSKQSENRVDKSKETSEKSKKGNNPFPVTKDNDDSEKTTKDRLVVQENVNPPIEEEPPESSTSVADESLTVTSTSSNELSSSCQPGESNDLNQQLNYIQNCDTSTAESDAHKSGPAISLVPLSFLIDPKLQTTDESEALSGVHLEKSAASSTAVSDLAQNGICQQAEKSNFKKPEMISKKLINKVATMDKTNIRNVINNPILKFDVALKMHAKKRLREEIRKQLRNISFENRKITGESTMQPDGYVDPESIPSEVLKQFESVLKMEFECGPETLYQPDLAATVDSSEDNLSDVCAESPSAVFDEHVQSGREINLRTKLLNLEFIKQQAILRRCRQQASESDDDVCIVETSMEQNRLTHDESSTDSSTTNTTANSSKASCMLPKSMLEEKFLDSFKREILPNLPQSVRNEYESSPGREGKIWKIYSLCLEKLSALGQQNELTKIQFQSSNTDEALDFLMQNVRDLFSVNKNETGKAEVPKAKRGRPPGKKTENANKKKTMNGKRVNSRWDRKTATVPCQQKEINSSTIESDHSTQLYANEATEEPNHGKVDDSSSSIARRERNIRTSKRKASCESVTESCKRISRCTPSIPASHSNYQLELVTSNMNRSPNQSIGIGTGHNSETATESNSIFTEFICPSRSSEQIEQSCANTPCSTESPEKSEEIKDATNSTNNCRVPINERLWRSPGEKKCLEPPVTVQVPTSMSPHAVRACTNGGDVAPDSTDKVVTTTLNTKDEDNSNTSAETNSLITSSVGGSEESCRTSFDTLKTLDMKLMDLNQQRMEIERKIITLQKEKMEIDFTVMQLQNDRFALISSVVSDPSRCLSTNPNLHNLSPNTTSIGFASIIGGEQTTPKSKKAKKKAKATSITNPKKKSAFAEKLKNRKKRCNRDILIEYSTSTLFPDSSKEHYEEIRSTDPTQITEKVKSMFSMPTRRSQRPVQVVTPEKPKGQNLKARSTKSPPAPSIESPPNIPTEILLPVSCVGQSVDIIENYSSDCDDEDNDSGHFSDSISSRPISNGQLKGFRLPIVKIIGVEDYILCASEDGNIYKFDSATRQLLATFSKHTESITQMCVDGQGCIYSTSLDGYMKKTSIENFGLELQSVNLYEPLQAVNLCWNTAFVGSRWGNVFTYDIKKSKLNESLLCSVGSAIIAIKATKEGPRRIIIISSRGERIHFRDAKSGLLLRTIDVRENQNISNIALNGGLLYCGSFSNKIFIYDFTTGNEINSFTCGNGAVSLQIFRDKLLFIGCYDGFIYVLDKQTGEQIGRFPGAGKMILALEIIGTKVLTSSKDGAVQIMDIPNYVLTHMK